MEVDDKDSRHPKYDTRVTCPSCDGEGHDYSVCPYCLGDSIREHFDAGTYCEDCGSLEGATRDEYPVCYTCHGVGYITPDDDKEPHNDND